MSTVVPLVPITPGVPNTGIKMLPHAAHIKEFYFGFHGTCGETALAELLPAAVYGCDLAHDEVVNLMHAIQIHMASMPGWEEPNQATFLWSLAAEAQYRKATVLIQWNYAEPFPHDWHSVIQQHAGVNGILMQFANADAVRDAAGTGPEPGVKYHFIAIVGIIPGVGYVCADPDNATVEARY